MYYFITACDVSKLILHEKVEFRSGLRTVYNVQRQRGRWFFLEDGVRQGEIAAVAIITTVTGFWVLIMWLSFFLCINSFNRYYNLVEKIFLFSFGDEDAKAERQISWSKSVFFLTPKYLPTIQVYQGLRGSYSLGLFILKHGQSWSKWNKLVTLMPEF